MAKKKGRTTHRRSTGKKLYAVRDKSGKFKDIQTYERARRISAGAFVAAVPIPAAAWLLGGALGALGIVRRAQATRR